MRMCVCMRSWNVMSVEVYVRAHVYIQIDNQ